MSNKNEIVQITKHFEAERRGIAASNPVRVTWVRRVNPATGGYSCEMTVLKDLDVTYEEPPRRTWLPATVSWPSIGSVPVEFAEEFAAALTWAIEEARRFDRDPTL